MTCMVMIYNICIKEPANDDYDYHGYMYNLLAIINNIFLHELNPKWNSFSLKNIIGRN